MCDYFSGVITRGGKVLTDESNSHDKIIEKFKLNDKKVFQDYLLFEIKPMKSKDDLPTKDNWNLKFESCKGQGQFEIPTWWKASYDNRIWSAFEKIQNARIKTLKQPIPEFNITIDASYLKKSISILKEVFNEVRIEIQKNRIRITAMDPANVAMIIWELYSSAADAWIVKEDFVFNANIEMLDSIFKNAKEFETIELGKAAGEDKLSIWLIGKSKREYTAPIIKSENEWKTPDLKFKAEVIMPSVMLNEQIREANTLGSSCAFQADKDFEIKTEDDFVKMRIENKDVSIKAEKSRAKYSLEYLMKMVRCDGISDEVKINFSTDYPLQLTYKANKIKFIWILAPRVES